MPWVFLALLLLQAGAAQPAEPTAAELFNLYQQRQFEAFTGGLARVQDFAALRRQIGRESANWPPEAKAAFLLETADAALQYKEPIAQSEPEAELLEDACKAVRQLPPQGEFEAAWHAAALSVLSAPYARGVSVDNHVKHIRGRFDAGRIAMIRAMPGERRSWHEATQVPLSRSGRAHMRDVVKLFEAARRFDSVRAEATIRQAALLTTWDVHAEALPLLASVDAMTEDPWLRYMAALVQGRSLQGAGRGAEAQAAYRSAANLQPNGKAARLALAAMLFSTGTRDEADRLVSEALSEQDGPVDPWREFLGGEFRFLEARKAAMRGLLR
jgi:tetratricopeptide (TPR) repeat protein